MRGKPFYQDFDKNGIGLIPACAGKTAVHHHHTDKETAHPRVCGENYRQSKFAHVQMGSSPRVRGKLTVGDWEGHAAGLIPACAGKTDVLRVYHQLPPAHPRVCGENSLDRSTSSRVKGSSPRVRGKLDVGCGVGVHFGLIPACAGKTGHTETNGD